MVGAADWATLPAALRRRFAAGQETARYHGTMRLSRSPIGAVFGWLGKAFGGPLPLATGEAIPTIVDVRASAGGVIWERHFGPDDRVLSVKSLNRRGDLIERTAGGLGMVLALSVEDGALLFTSRCFFLAIGRWSLPVPALLTPGVCRVEHRAVDERRFRFTMTMTHRLWGVTFRQSGIFTDPE
jgi:hypothetical protein